MFLALWSVFCTAEAGESSIEVSVRRQFPTWRSRGVTSGVLFWLAARWAKPINIALLMAHFFGNKISFNFAITAG